MLDVLDWILPGSCFKLVQVVSLDFTLASDELGHCVEKVEAREVVEAVLQVPFLRVDDLQSIIV